MFSNKVKDDPSKEIFKDRKYESQDPSIMLLHFALFLIIIYIASNHKTCITEVCSITFAWVTLSFNTSCSLKVLRTTFSGNVSKNVSQHLDLSKMVLLRETPSLGEMTVG